MEDHNNNKSHALCLPYPVQSHIKAMLKFAKLLRHKGFQITFVNTEFNQARFDKIASLDTDQVPATGFRFETIPDSMPPSDPDASQDISMLCHSVRTNFSGPLLELVNGINDSVVCPPVTCLVADGFMSLAVGSTTEQLGIPFVKLFTVSANSLVGFQQYRPLLNKGIIPIQDEGSVTYGNLDNTIIDWPIAGMNGLRFRDLPSCWRITDTNNIIFNFLADSVESLHDSSAVVIQTFHALEQEVLESLSSKVPHLCAIGPLQLLLNNQPNDPLEAIQYSLWKEEMACLEWLDAQKPNSVVYINFGSIVVLTPQQLVDIGWGLVNSKHPFLWVIRPDLVIGESGCFSQDFMDETKDRSMIISWCPQEDVLNHPSVGGFLTHCGWNSVLEGLSSGVPLLCYPFFADQQTNCWLACNGLGVGVEIDKDVKRDDMEELVRDLMEREKGKQMKSKAMEWKKLAQEATSPHGTSTKNLDNLVSQLLLPKK